MEKEIVKAEAFIKDDESSWEELGGGVKRKIATYDDNLMQVIVAFEKGAIGDLHQHVHTQISYVASGKFEVEIDGKKEILDKGDSFYVAPNLLHGVVCLADGVLVDVFNPFREDFL